VSCGLGIWSAVSTYRSDIPDDTDYPQQDGTSGELFAQVSYVSPYTQVEPVLDSSRYFVLRVEGEGGKRAYIGMGFEERGDAFDFQVSKSTSDLGLMLVRVVKPDWATAADTDSLGRIAECLQADRRPVYLILVGAFEARRSTERLLAEGGSNVQNQNSRQGSQVFWRGRLTGRYSCEWGRRFVQLTASTPRRKEEIDGRRGRCQLDDSLRPPRCSQGSRLWWDQRKCGMRMHVECIQLRPRRDEHSLEGRR
jgi:hypothetical protein